MNGYRPETRQTPHVIAAFALSVLTVSALVVGPAHISAADRGAPRTAAETLPVEVAIVPSVIRVVATRHSNWASMPTTASDAKQKV